MHYPIIITKKGKFRKIASQLFDIISMMNYFSGCSRSLSQEFTKEEHEIKQTLWNVYQLGLTPRYENNPEYDHYIQMALAFITEVVDKYVPEERRKHRNGEPFSVDNLKRCLRHKEMEDWKLGSPFVCVLTEDVHIKQIPLLMDEDGRWKNHLYGILTTLPLTCFKQPVSAFEEGLYEIIQTGERFDVRREVIDIPYNERETHTLRNYLLPDPSEDGDETTEPNCYRCGDGGCPQCDTTGFFTGLTYDN